MDGIVIPPMAGMCTAFTRSDGTFGNSCAKDYGTTDLGKAMQICAAHISYGSTLTVPPPRVPKFRQGWEACEKIWDVWLKTEDARQEEERKAEQERQRGFINEFAGTLK